MVDNFRYAILFKVHFWDSFVERQFRRLCLRAGAGHVFVVVDDTKGPVQWIFHDDVLRLTEAMSEADGYLRYPAGSLFWYNTDYQVYHFIDKRPDFDYIFVCEYDCVVNCDVADVIRLMARGGLGFVGERNRTPPEQWLWAASARPYYADNVEISGRLLCCAAFSREFARQLQSARRDQTRRVLGHAGPSLPPGAMTWPINEAFVGAEIARLAVAEAPLSAFGNTSCYDWAPPFPEFALSTLRNCAFVHPMVDSGRYLQAIKKIEWSAEDLFNAGSPLQSQMERYDPADVVSMFAQEFITSRAFGTLDLLRHYAERRCGSPGRYLFNVALGKRATQSSVCEWSRARTPQQDAAGAVNGEITGHIGFHTGYDQEPWWYVDLEADLPVIDILIFNRMDQPSRSRSLIVSFSSDLANWNALYQHSGDQDFGGADGRPLHIELLNPVQMRFLRIHLPRRDFLHLDEVQIYI